MAESRIHSSSHLHDYFSFVVSSRGQGKVNGAELSTSNYSIAGYSTSGSGTVTITSTVNTGDIVRIYRDTDVASPEATFAAGASIKAADLNNNNQQLQVYKLEEKIDSPSNIASRAVTTDAIRDLNVTTAKLADGSVTTAKIAGGRRYQR